MDEISRLYAKKPIVKRSNSSLRIQRKKSSQQLKSPADRILFLQRTIGNQAVQRMVRSGALQAKLSIGQPGDVYEQEADRVADAVMRMPESGVHRQVEPEEEEEETLQAKPLSDQITPLVQRQVEPEEEEERLQVKPFANQITPLVQRQPEPLEEEEKQIQPKSNTGMAPQVTQGVAHDIHSFKGTGQPLPASERTFFEPRFGRDFSNVRVHTNERAARTAQTINARAFTLGRNVVFGAGQYSPGSSSGRKLLAHELTHVVQEEKVGRGAHMPNNIRNHSLASSDIIHRKIVTAKAKLNYYFASITMDTGPYIISALNAPVTAIWSLNPKRKYSIYATASQVPPHFSIGMSTTPHRLAKNRRGRYEVSRFRVKPTYFTNINKKGGSVDIQVYEKGFIFDIRIFKVGLRFLTEKPFVVAGKTKAWPKTVRDVSPPVHEIKLGRKTKEIMSKEVKTTKTQGFALTKQVSTTNTIGSSITTSIGKPDVASIGSNINVERAITKAVTVKTNVRYSETTVLKSEVSLEGPGIFQIFPLAYVWETPITLNTFDRSTGKKTGTKNAAIYTVKYTGTFDTEKKK